MRDRAVICSAAQEPLLFVGLLGAAVLNGQFALVETWFTTSGLASHPWRGVLYAAAAAAAVFGVLLLLIRRLLDASPFRPGMPHDPRHPGTP